MNLEKLFSMAHVIANADPQKCLADVEEFIENKKEVKTHWNTSAVVTGMQMVGKMPQAQTTIITTCLIHWRATAEERNNFLAGQKLKLS